MNGAPFFGGAKESDEGDAGIQSIGSAVVQVTPGDYFELIVRQTARPPGPPRTSLPTNSPGSPSRSWSSAYVVFFRGFGVAWDDATVARWTNTPLGMLRPEVGAPSGFADQGQSNDPC